MTVLSMIIKVSAVIVILAICIVGVTEVPLCTNKIKLNNYNWTKPISEQVEPLRYQELPTLPYKEVKNG